VVSFRFFLVSITAVFLALAVGITMGATVIDTATVNALRAQIKRVENSVANTNGLNDDLSRRLNRDNDFADQAAPGLVKERLANVPVLVVAVRGADRDAIDAMRQLLVAAGARLEGTVWLTSKLRLDKAEDAAALATALGLDPSSADGTATGGGGPSPDTVRRAALTRLADAWGGADVRDPLAALKEGGFVDYEPAATKDPSTVPESGTRYVVASNTQPDVPNDQAAVPFTTELARVTTDRVLAAEAGREARNKQPEVREGFTGPLRTDAGVRGRLSSVDDLEDVRGRVVAVYALANLASGKLGHFGFGPHVDRLSPEP